MGLYVAEDRSATAQEDGVIGGDEGHRRGQHFLAFHLGGQHGQVQSRRSRVQGDHVLDAEVLGKALFEFCGSGAGTDPARGEGIAQSLDFFFAERGSENGYAFFHCGFFPYVRSRALASSGAQ